MRSRISHDNRSRSGEGSCQAEDEQGEGASRKVGDDVQTDDLTSGMPLKRTVENRGSESSCERREEGGERAVSNIFLTRHLIVFPLHSEHEKRQAVVSATLLSHVPQKD